MAFNSTMTSTEISKQLLFGWLDFTIFILMMCVSTLIGVYFGFWGKKEDTPKEYLHGGKTMSVLPVAVSLIASFVSGILMMGAPTEVYLYGTLYWGSCFSIIIVGIVTNYLYLPVFYELQITSTYEYLQLRFNRSVRIMASVLYTLNLLLYIPIVVYVPALAFSQVSGLNVHFITPVISILCIFYTTVGGIKGVIWTDFLQGILMVLASIIVIILGVIHIGGPGIVWQRSEEGGRIRLFEMQLSPFVRLSFLSMLIGFIFIGIGGVSLNQALVQKFMSLPTYSKVQMSLVIFVFEKILVTSLSCYTGLLIYSTYYKCDPIQSEIISRADQLLPYYVMDVGSSIPGLAGLFTAGIFSASLSTMSSCLNSLGATLYEDFVRPCFKNKISDKLANNIIKCVVVVIGAICVLTVFVVDKLGSVLELNLSASGVANGAVIGLFSFGMFYPRGNSKGALAGSICSMLIMGWIVFGTQKAIADGSIKQPVLPSSVEGCDFNVTIYDASENDDSEKEVFILYRLSFMYYTPCGAIIMFLVGAIVSSLTESPDIKKINPALFSPIVRKYVVNKYKISNRNTPAENKLLYRNTNNNLKQ